MHKKNIVLIYGYTKVNRPKIPTRSLPLDRVPIAESWLCRYRCYLWHGSIPLLTFCGRHHVFT